jgi:hypothetical protein
VLLALALAGCSGGGDTIPTIAPFHSVDFIPHPNAVQGGNIDGKPSRGIEHLVPVGPCAIGIGSYADGQRTVGVNWAGYNDCTSFSATAPGGTALSATSAVAMPDGSLIGANNVLQRLNPDGTVSALADLHLPSGGLGGDTGQTSAVVRSGDRLVIGGGQRVGGETTPLMWISDDGGRTVTPVTLPPVVGYVGAMAASGDTIVAVEQTAEQNRLGIWRSTDRGRTWQLGRFAAATAYPMITNVLPTRHGWLLVGSGEDERADGARPFLASSPDGVTWQEQDLSKLGHGRILDATITKQDELVLIGQGKTGVSAGKMFGCGVAWTGTIGALRQVDLGCDDVPKATTTLADGRVIIVGASSVWVKA